MWAEKYLHLNKYLLVTEHRYTFILGPTLYAESKKDAKCKYRNEQLSKLHIIT